MRVGVTLDVRSRGFDRSRFLFRGSRGRRGSGSGVQGTWDYDTNVVLDVFVESRGVCIVVGSLAQ